MSHPMAAPHLSHAVALSIGVASAAAAAALPAAPVPASLAARLLSARSFLAEASWPAPELIRLSTSFCWACDQGDGRQDATIARIYALRAAMRSDA